GKSLLPAGITNVEGDFSASDAVRLCDSSGREIARGIVNYSSSEIAQIKGNHSEKIPLILGYDGPETIVHIDNLIVQD
ncbi:MAG: PUA domain-containing protein, partial [Xenococcaceae cyanobacterium]